MLKRNLFKVLLAALISSLFLMIIFPNLMIYSNFHFMISHDPATNYNNFLNIFSEFKNGGIQFWNIYDLTSTFFVQLSYGIYNFQNILTSTIFFFINSFVNLDINYHSYFSFTFFFIGILIRCFGFYILLNYILSNNFLAIFGTIISNIFITYHLNVGLVTINLLSYLPLILFVIIKIFDKPTLKFFLFLFLLGSICIANSPLMTLGYFYMTLHVFVLSLFIRNILDKKITINKFQNFILFHNKNIIKILLTLLISSLIILPYIMMLKYLSSDYFIPDSGLHGTSGRLKQILTPYEYFTKDIYTNNFKDFLNTIFDYKTHKWQYSWLFVNNFIIFFTFIGAIFSKSRVKLPLVFTIIFLLGLNLPNDPNNILSIFHWITVLTNPFSFLLRSFHMINLIIPFFILPLFLLGIKELFNHLKNYNEINSTKYFILLILYNVFSLCFISNSNNVYLLLSNIIIILIFFSFNIQKLFYRKIFSIGLFFILIFVELLFLSKYINLVNPNYLKLINKDNLYLINKTDPRSQPLENVALKSLPKNYTEYFTPWANPLYPGSYYKVIQFNNFKKPYLYNPVHNSLKNLHNDQIIQKYIIKNNELISFKKSVYINEDNINLIKYEKKMNIGNSYFFLNNNKKLIKYDNSISDKLAKNIIKDRNFKFILPFDKNLYTLNKKNNFYQVIYNLPKNFPKNLTSSTITKNLKSVNYQIEIDNIKKALLEGNMNQIYQINVNDMIKNKIILNINENDINKINKIYLSFELDYNYLDLAKKNYDNYEFNYYSEQDGYLLINMPYDNKWSIKVNDNASEIYKANKYFMAIKISKGHNLIEMGYMNNTLLRNLLYISICLIFFSLMYIHYNILRNPIN